MADLKPCPFCGGKRIGVMIRFPLHGEMTSYYAICNGCGARSALHVEEQFAITAWNRRTTVETNIYDKEETYPNCTVQVLTNTATGETSVGWWENGGE